MILYFRLYINMLYRAAYHQIILVSGFLCLYAQVAKPEDAPGSGSGAIGHEGSNPSLCTSSNVRKEGKMLEIKGKVNTAICYAKVIEEEAIEQIRRMCDYPMTRGSRIRIMLERKY